MKNEAEEAQTVRRFGVLDSGPWALFIVRFYGDSFEHLTTQSHD